MFHPVLRFHERSKFVHVMTLETFGAFARSVCSASFPPPWGSPRLSISMASDGEDNAGGKDGPIAIGLTSPSSFGKASRKLRAYRDWPPDEELDAEESRLRGLVTLVEDDINRGVRAEDPKMARKLARARFKLWSLTLRKTSVEGTREAYERLLSFPSMRDNCGLWVSMHASHASYCLSSISS